MLKKVRFVKSFRCDILFFDSVGENWIDKCFPPEHTVGRIEIRDHIPIILTLSFFVRLLKGFMFHRRERTGFRSLIWLTALFDEINPRIIFTCADNNIPLAQYAEKHPNINVIYLQNALRDTKGSIPHGVHLPIYLSLGSIEKNIFPLVDVTCQSYQPVGSVKLGLAIEAIDINRTCDFDLSFISHYRPELFSNDCPELFTKIEGAQRALFIQTVTYARANSMSLVVVSKTREKTLQEEELKYFSNLAEGITFVFTRADKNAHELDTYHAALSSNLVIHPASTLGFEMLAAGKKVLFGASQDPKLLEAWGINEYFSLLPNFLKLRSTSTTAFHSACDFLFKIDNIAYKDQIQECASSIITMPDKTYPHKVIQELLRSRLL